MPSESAIKVSNLTKYYGKLLAVDQISFEVKGGELFGFLGPNGAGKTTTINMLTGVAKATSGHAFISGHEVAREPVKAKEHIGVVSDASSVYDEMTAWDNINFSAKLHGVPKEKKEILAREFLELFGLYERRNDHVGTFSTGMKRRLMIATALVHEPEILFLDEPTSGLDVQSSRHVRDMLRELNRKGTTIFLTTHYIEEADQLCQRVAIINQGKIVALDNPEKLKASVEEHRIIEVSFSPIRDLVSQLKELRSVSHVLRVGDKFRVYVDDPSETLPLIFDFAKENHLKVVSVNTLKTTLEDAFVKITGLSHEVMAIEKEHVKPAQG